MLTEHNPEVGSVGRIGHALSQGIVSVRMKRYAAMGDRLPRLFLDPAVADDPCAFCAELRVEGGLVLGPAAWRSRPPRGLRTLSSATLDGVAQTRMRPSPCTTDSSPATTRVRPPHRAPVVDQHQPARPHPLSQARLARLHGDDHQDPAPAGARDRPAADSLTEVVPA